MYKLKGLHEHEIRESRFALTYMIKGNSIPSALKQEDFTPNPTLCINFYHFFFFLKYLLVDL